ncbi:MAG: hypothetical protein D3910_01590 [Candidatus Electrothrix sp. ATG2]|nr:hypothetical protein [Candidatus Electrothrix sp. ATG2]
MPLLLLEKILHYHAVYHQKLWRINCNLAIPLKKKALGIHNLILLKHIEAYCFLLLFEVQKVSIKSKVIPTGNSKIGFSQTAKHVCSCDSDILSPHDQNYSSTALIISPERY